MVAGWGGGAAETSRKWWPEVWDTLDAALSGFAQSREAGRREHRSQQRGGALDEDTGYGMERVGGTPRKWRQTGHRPAGTDVELSSCLDEDRLRLLQQPAVREEGKTVQSPKLPLTFINV